MADMVDMAVMAMEEDMVTEEDTEAMEDMAIHTMEVIVVIIITIITGKEPIKCLTKASAIPPKFFQL